MLNPQQVGDLIERLVDARLDGDRKALTDLLDNLIQGPKVDSLNVALLLAGILAVDVAEVEPEGFHRVTVRHIDEDGSEHEGSALDLPAHVATFAQMVVAIANGDRAMAKDLFIGYLGREEDAWRRAITLIVFALAEVVHANSDCPACAAEGAS